MIGMGRGWHGLKGLRCHWILEGATFLKRFAHCKHMSHMSIGSFPKISGLKMIGFVYFDRPETFFWWTWDIFWWTDVRCWHGYFLKGGPMNYFWADIRKHTCANQASQNSVGSDEWYCFQKSGEPARMLFLSRGHPLFPTSKLTCHCLIMIRKVEANNTSPPPGKYKTFLTMMRESYQPQLVQAWFLNHQQLSATSTGSQQN